MIRDLQILVPSPEDREERDDCETGCLRGHRSRCRNFHGALCCPGVAARHAVCSSGHAYGGGLGRIFKLGDQPVSAYYNVVHPTGTPNWQLRAELSLLFPER
jgi:hypothetical protein